MLLNSGVIVILTRQTTGGERWGVGRRGLFDAWCLVTNGSLRFRGFAGRGKEESYVGLVVIRADTAEEGDTVLRTQVLNQTSSANAS